MRTVVSLIAHESDQVRPSAGVLGSGHAQGAFRFSGATDPRHIQSMYQEGASSFVPKPQDAETLKHTTERMMAYWLALVLLPEEERPRAARGEPR